MLGLMLMGLNPFKAKRAVLKHKLAVEWRKKMIAIWPDYEEMARCNDDIKAGRAEGFLIDLWGRPIGMEANGS